MTSEQINIVKENFNQLEHLAEEIATEFYKRLFQIDVTLRPLFNENLSEQKKKLVMMLKFAVGTLDRMDVFEPSLEELGRKHGACGMRETHYETVGTALILTLRKVLSAVFTEKLEAAWIAAYMLIAGLMCRAACATRTQTNPVIFQEFAI
jgi:hemoglobin-like flavoprotein